MARSFFAYPILKIRLSSQSGNKVMTAAYAAIYTLSDQNPFDFVGGSIDLTNMADGDSVDIRIRKTIASGGGYIVMDETSYAGNQPAGRELIELGSITNIYGLEISMRQTLGTLRTFATEFFEAVR